MDYNELITDLQQVPKESEAAAENIAVLLKHAKYLEGRSDVAEPLARDVLAAAPCFIHKQLERLELHLNDEPDIIAVISRNLMELWFLLRYMYTSRERYDEVFGEQLTDLKEIENILYPSGSPEKDDPDAIKAFHADMRRLWKGMEEYGVKRDELIRPNVIKYYAEGANLLNEYNSFWRIHSKYAHPTSYLLFGRTSVVFGDDPRRFFLACAQYFAARNLRDLHKMIKAAANQ
jgi:hypothetical protein